MVVTIQAYEEVLQLQHMPHMLLHATHASSRVCMCVSVNNIESVWWSRYRRMRRSYSCNTCHTCFLTRVCVCVSVNNIQSVRVFVGGAGPCVWRSRCRWMREYCSHKILYMPYTACRVFLDLRADFKFQLLLNLEVTLL